MRVLITVLLFWAAACTLPVSVRNILAPRPPYERYVSALTAAGVHHSPPGAAWIAAGTEVLSVPRSVRLHHSEIVTLSGSDASAVAYQVSVRRGRVYHAIVEDGDGRPVNAFIDVFHVEGSGALRHVGGAGPPERRLPYEPLEDSTLVVRVQAELLRGGTLRIGHADRPALLFPVAGSGRRDVHSFFDAPRDGGRRRHQGIDIFAARGTPVVAAADGWISSTSPNELGGNVVWLWDPARGHTLYYAHLDSSSVQRGDRVRKGDVIGRVGATGNARGTAPHLHFGIYRRAEGAVDPLHYVTSGR